MPGSRRQAATPRSTAKGYMATRWYQQSRHGGKWATSERKRLPPVATRATSHASGRATGRSRPGSPCPVRRPGAPRRPSAAWTTTASRPAWARTVRRPRPTTPARTMALPREHDARLAGQVEEDDHRGAPEGHVHQEGAVGEEVLGGVTAEVAPIQEVEVAEDAVEDERDRK